jgi:hypothetical protein
MENQFCQDEPEAMADEQETNFDFNNQHFEKRAKSVGRRNPTPFNNNLNGFLNNSVELTGHNNNLHYKQKYQNSLNVIRNL